MKVLVGLGNPGKEYIRTRHNIGWTILDALAPKIGGGSFKLERPVEVAEAFFQGEKVYLIKPLTFMNRSGQALASWLGRFREIREAIQETDGRDERTKPGEKDEEAEACIWPGLLVISDDVNLPLGRLRFRSGGSAGGHNGLKDIEKALGGRGYPRLRYGVDAPGERQDRIEYVLGRFSAGEMPRVEETVDIAANAVVDWIRAGLPAVQDKYNGNA